MECVAEDALTGLAGDELDALHDAVYDYVLDAGVFSLGVLADQDGVDAVVWGLVSFDGAAGSDVGEEVEGSAEGQVEGNMAFSNWCLKNV